MQTESIHRLDTYSVKSDALLECLGVIFSSCIQHAHSLNELSLRYSSSVVAHADPEMVFHIHLYTLSHIHAELVDRVVHHLFQQHINTIFCYRTVSQPTDIHTRSGTDMLHIR